jgi:hypothetical protein
MVETGYGRKLRTEVSEINLEALMSGQSDTLFPLVIETSALDDFVPAALNQAIRHQFTYFHLDMADGHFVLRPIRVKIQVGFSFPFLLSSTFFFFLFLFF